MSDTDRHELSFEETAGAHPDFPRIVIRKMDTALRGVTITKRALERAKEEGALHDAYGDLGLRIPRPVLGGAVFRDGTASGNITTARTHFSPIRA